MLMGKVVLFCALIALVLGGCSKSESERGEEDDRTAIVMSLGSPLPDVSVRGTGAIGLIDGKWDNQKLKIMAFRKGKISEDAADVTGIPPTGIIGTTNANAATSGLIWDGGVTLYYPIQNAYDFYGYYIDDIADNPVITPDVEGAPGEVAIGVTIDGTQDLLVSKAILTDAQKTMLDGSLTTDEEKEKEYAKAYSSYAARRGVQPNMLFKHLLSRLTFEVKSGESDILGNDPDGVYITAVELKNVETKGVIHISVAEQKLNITPVEEAHPVDLSLGIKNLVTIDGLTFDGIKPNSLTDYVSMGESIMPMPGQKSFNAVIKMRQIKDGKLITINGKNEFSFDAEIKAPIVKDKDTGATLSDIFVAGYSYRVKLTMYGLKPVEITAELAPWKQGEDIEITPGE